MIPKTGSTVWLCLPDKALSSSVRNMFSDFHGPLVAAVPGDGHFGLQTGAVPVDRCRASFRVWISGRMLELSGNLN